MDQAFLMRARRLLDERRTTLDHAALLSHIISQAAATPTFQASVAINQIRANDDEGERVCALILGTSEWRSAARRQGGCFNRAAAKQRVNIL